MATAGPWRDLSAKNGKPLLSETTFQVLESLKFENMTPVQSATIPLFMQNKDVAVEACTGSGKTLAFVIPIIEMLNRKNPPLKKHEVGAIVITPVRELAIQINEVFQHFLSKYTQFTSLLLIGGTELEDDIKNLKTNGASIVIATPGRLEYIMQRTEFNVKELEVLVLDEADRLLEMGFQVSISAILSKLPKQRRTGLFSATQTNEVVELIRAGLRNPVRVAIKVQSNEKAVQRTPSSLTNFYTIIDADKKLNQLVHFLVKNKTKKFIVYFLTCACVNYFYKALEGLNVLKGITLLSLHGKVPAKQRNLTYKKFVSAPGNCALFCTDVASRGLDIPDVDWIIQYDPPQDPDVFIHRIGRTARMGREGSALAFLHPNEDNYVEFLAVKKVPIVELPADSTTINVLPEVKKRQTKERELFEKCQLAFVSFIRAYKEHHCSYIFRLDRLNIGKLATGFGTLILPKMKELLKRKDIEFTTSDFKIEDIPYKDKIREKKRKEKLKNREKEKQEEKERRMNPEKEEENDFPMESSDSSDENDDSDDIEDFMEEERLYKKLKKRKISQEEFDKATGLDVGTPKSIDKSEEIKAKIKEKIAAMQVEKPIKKKEESKISDTTKPPKMSKTQRKNRKKRKIMSSNNDKT